MNSFQDYIKKEGWDICPNGSKYCEVGETVCFKTDDFNGLYWFYETDLFIIDIHDFFVNNEIITHFFTNMRPFMSYISTYIKTANGECFTPYQTLTANSIFVANIKHADIRFLLHEKFPFVSVGINFKDKMIEEYISDSLNLGNADIEDVFYDTRELVTKPLEKIANAILTCNMNTPAAHIFLEAKAKEWLSITIDAYFNKRKVKAMSKSDETAIKNVANYINDHYALDVTQDLLEKIAMMSGTKLKNVFKQQYKMSITEYLQRKRMNIAETLLSTTELEIKDIAKSVGYRSHSRFTNLFKKYKGIYPREVKKMSTFSESVK